MDTLANLERVDTDNKDRPIEDLTIERTIVFVDPFTEVDEEVTNWSEPIAVCVLCITCRSTDYFRFAALTESEDHV